MSGPNKRGHGDGGIDARGVNTWRLRYRLNGRRYTKTVEGTKAQAQKALRDLLHVGGTGAPRFSGSRLPAAATATGGRD